MTRYKILRVVMIGIGMLLLGIIASEIKHPFWKEQNYIKLVNDFRREPDIFPYKLRQIWWSDLIIVKSGIERAANIFWNGSRMFLLPLATLILIKRKKKLELGLVGLGLLLIALNLEPNLGRYLPMLIPFIISGIFL